MSINVPPAISQTVQLAPFGALAAPPVSLAYPSQLRVIASVTVNNETNGTVSVYLDRTDTNAPPDFTISAGNVKTINVGARGIVLFGFSAPNGGVWAGAAFVQVSTQALSASSGITQNTINVSASQKLLGADGVDFATVDSIGRLYVLTQRFNAKLVDVIVAAGTQFNQNVDLDPYETVWVWGSLTGGAASATINVQNTMGGVFAGGPVTATLAVGAQQLLAFGPGQVNPSLTRFAQIFTSVLAAGQSLHLVVEARA